MFIIKMIKRFKYFVIINGLMCIGLDMSKALLLVGLKWTYKMDIKERSARKIF